MANHKCQSQGESQNPSYQSRTSDLNDFIKSALDKHVKIHCNIMASLQTVLEGCPCHNTESLVEISECLVANTTPNKLGAIINVTPEAEVWSEGFGRLIKKLKSSGINTLVCMYAHQVPSLESTMALRSQPV